MTAALNAVGRKWSLICLYWLNSGMRRFNELRRLTPDISHKVLTATLRNLEEEELIRRSVYAEVPLSRGWPSLVTGSLNEIVVLIFAPARHTLP
jgi:DNA-binding HxlR family transcriptional regulator